VLSGQELARYDRQLTIPDWGEDGQRKLKDSKVVVVGVGGLGSAVLLYLAVAGVGTIRVVDSDVVALTNLNRQVLYTDADVGRKKVDSGVEKLGALNPYVKVEPMAEPITEENALDILSDYPIVDALDNLPGRYVINRVAVEKGLPLFHGAVHGFEGAATTLIPGTTPCLRCLYREVSRGSVPVAGVTAAVVGCVQATEFLKYVLGIGDMLVGRMLSYDGLAMRFTEFRLKRDPDCDVCGRAD
jgi:adenylyltransferase/sulfurtransferase